MILKSPAFDCEYALNERHLDERTHQFSLYEGLLPMLKENRKFMKVREHLSVDDFRA